MPASLGINDVAQFVARAKADTTGFAYASIRCRLAVATMHGGDRAEGGRARLLHIPYAGSPAAATALIRGDVQAACLPAIAVTPHAASGALKMLAVSTPQRSPLLPHLPTLKESGIDVQSDAWNALIAPGGTPPALIERISAEVREILAEPAVIAKLATAVAGRNPFDACGTASENPRREAAVGRRDPRREDPDRIATAVPTGKSHGGGLTHRRRS